MTTDDGPTEGLRRWRPRVERPFNGSRACTSRGAREPFDSPSCSTRWPPSTRRCACVSRLRTPRISRTRSCASSRRGPTWRTAAHARAERFQLGAGTHGARVLREAYLDLVERARRDIPGVALSSDFISGFCGETEEEHADTVSLMTRVGYEQAFMFAYSEREGTSAARNLEDDVPEDVKQEAAAGDHRCVPRRRRKEPGEGGGTRAPVHRGGHKQEEPGGTDG